MASDGRGFGDWQDVPYVPGSFVVNLGGAAAVAQTTPTRSFAFDCVSHVRRLLWSRH
jgi:hypothetical protein